MKKLTSISIRNTRRANSARRTRRGSALAEFVLFLPFVFFIIAMIHHFGVGMLRKQRTIVAARFAADTVVRGIGGPNENDYWTHPISNNQYARGQEFPDPHDHFLGLFRAEEIQWRFLPRLTPASVDLGGSWPDDGLQRLKQEIDQRDMGLPRATEITRTFWEVLAATDQVLGVDFDYRWHRYAYGARVQADYRPNGPYYERLGGPIATHFYREYGSWHDPRPDMWWELTRSAPGLADAEDAFYELVSDPAMGLTGDAIFRWFQH